MLRAQYEHETAVLIGQPVSSFALAPQLIALGWCSIGVAVPAGHAACAIMQANAQVGLAKKAFFPSLPLTASLRSR